MHLIEAQKMSAVDSGLMEAIREAFRAFEPHKDAVSLRHISEMVRASYPMGGLSEDALNTYVGDYAILGGFNVHFDVHAGNDADFA